ncbi:hypothetical protein [Metabacillus fastidiosus]|uniref:hypothetical protein n=1 Tax=Metabacillus fastidiosus TaxID=1458 RepID=UPI003D29499D
MAFLCISDVYACVHKTLREDEVIRGLMGFDNSTTDLEMELRIQKRKKPVNLVSENLPLITFYKAPGQRETNHLVYVTEFYFNIYTGNNVEVAIDIADRINELFDDKYLNLSKGSNFKGQFITSAEDATDLENTYKYFTKLKFSFELEG